MKKNVFYLVLLWLFSSQCFAQFSKTHYIPPVTAPENTGVSIGTQFLYISTPSIVPVNFVIKQIGNATISGTVTRDNPFEYNINSSNSSNQFVVNQSNINSVQTNKGYIIEAGDLIYASVRVTSGDEQQNQAGQLVSKGLAALGTSFRIGGFINTIAQSYGATHLTFISILATENNTVVSFADIRPGAVLINNPGAGNTPNNVTLNSGQSYVLAVQGPTFANRDALIGSKVTSNKPIVVNCGSIGGTNGSLQNLDFGFDQIVSAERTGTEYIFIKSTGFNDVERALLIANEDNTDFFLNGNTTTTPNFTLNAGTYVALNGTNFNAAGNLYVRTSKNIFAYQSIGDITRGDEANQEMFFVPPLSCQTPKTIDNIPMIEKIGPKIFIGRSTIITKIGSTLNFIINALPYTLSTLPTGVIVNGPTAVTGNTAYECYTITGLEGNVSIYSTSELYVAAYGSNDAATFGGYYSGFTFKPEIAYQPITATASNCIPNINLQVSSLTGFDTFQWFFNDLPIAGATSSGYNPTIPGFYYVSATISSCAVATTLISDKIPVSNCPTNQDNDLAIDNLDLDYDNDGITNCTESFGDQIINLANTANGTINVNSGEYVNNFTGTITTSTTASPIPFVGNADGSFISDIPAGKGNFVTYALAFSQPITLGMSYITTANTTDLINSNGEFKINSPTNKTITVVNPNNQLLIDTNYDGIYESGITTFSSFEIRFRLNSTVPLAAGTGAFRFTTYLPETLLFTHSNLSDTASNKATFKLFALCVPRDSDDDLVPDNQDRDSDNDGIPDYFEAQGQPFAALTNADTNTDGIDNAFGNGLTPIDSDNDGVPNYLDLDSDNDGIFDVIESGSPTNANNTNGTVQSTNFGANGIDNALETFADSGILNYTIADTDADGKPNYTELDSDNDFCNDATEAGFTDLNNDGIVGDDNPTVIDNGFGLVLNSDGYAVPNNNYTISAPIIITTQPSDETECELQNATFSVVANSISTYQWQLSTDNGTSWNNITNDTTYSNATTAALTVSGITNAMNNYKYRVFLNRNGNSCGLFSNEATLTVLDLPTVTSPITLVQCDIPTFNLTQKNNVISSDFATQTFTYFTNSAAAFANDSGFLISNPTAYNSASTSVFARVQNANGCFSIAQINLILSTTQIPASVVINDFVKCDDFLDAVNNDLDGIATFDFSSVTPQILNALPPPSSGSYSLNYYRNEADFLAETDASGNSLAIPTAEISNYRNIGYPNQQTIYVRVENTATNDCFGSRTFNLIVEALPIINNVGTNNIIRSCDDDQNGTFIFDTSTLEATLLGNQTNKTISYQDQNGNAIASPFPATYQVTTSQIITVTIRNNENVADDAPCLKTGTFQFIVDDLPQAFNIPIGQLTQCDDELDPELQDGTLSFITTGIESTILGGQTGMQVLYTFQNGSTSTVLPNPFTTSTQNVIVRVTNPINPNCFDETTLNFVVNPLPRIDLNANGEENVIICSDSPQFTTTINAGITGGVPQNAYTYQWFLNQIAIPGETGYFLTTNTAGSYSVLVTSNAGCTATRNIEIIPSNAATISTVDITDLVENNTVTINVTGTGNYVYSIQEAYGPYQTSNVFTNVPIGFHIVYVKDLNGCGVTQQIISVLGIPKYFTPNGDGYNDTWNVAGANAQFYPNSVIYIYDRFGKLLQQISPLSSGWDGTINGNLAPSDDYWYDINFDDGRNAKGHFSLKR